ncbi:nitrogen assimilation regulatory protein, partial [Vibrio parahaemolyticus V-223/04]
TKSGTCRWISKLVCCACWRMASSTVLVVTLRFVSMYVLSPPRTKTSKSWYTKAIFVKTCSTA